MKNKTFIETALLIVIAGIIFYIVCPKYEIYQGEALIGTQIITVRFNKITGTFQELTGRGWEKGRYGDPCGYIKRPSE